MTTKIAIHVLPYVCPGRKRATRALVASLVDDRLLVTDEGSEVLRRLPGEREQPQGRWHWSHLPSDGWPAPAGSTREKPIPVYRYPESTNVLKAVTLAMQTLYSSNLWPCSMHELFVKLGEAED